MSVKGKVCLITGGSSGIGKATAELLAENGAKISICDIDLSNAEKLADELNLKHGKDTAISLKCDVTDEDSFRVCFQETIKKFGYVDILHNNAGIWNDSAAVWRKQIEINLNGVITGCLLALEFMGTQKGGRGGTVVNMSSYLGILTSHLMPIYSAAKAGVFRLTRDLGTEFHYNMHKVKFVCICPNGTTTNLFQDMEKHFMLPGPEIMASFTEIAATVGDFQGPISVAQAVLHAIEEGDNGSTWAVGGGKYTEVRVEEFDFADDLGTGASIAVRL